MAAGNKEPKVPSIAPLPTPPVNTGRDARPAPAVEPGNRRSVRSREDRMAGEPASYQGTDEDVQDTTTGEDEQAAPEPARSKPSRARKAGKRAEFEVEDPERNRSLPFTCRPSVEPHEWITGIRRAMETTYGVKYRVIDDAMIQVLQRHRKEWAETVQAFKKPVESLDDYL